MIVERLKELKGIFIIFCVMAVIFTTLPRFISMADEEQDRGYEINTNTDIERELEKLNI